MPHEAILYDTLPGFRVHCNVCQWRCMINPGKMGVCRVRRNDAGVLYSLNYAHISAAAVDPIEKKPLFHFYPGTQVFSLGGWGCNFHCAHCQNWEIACVESPAAADRQDRMLNPEDAVKAALSSSCKGIAWTYNEPGIWFEYTLDCARLARESGLYTVYVTNGFLTDEALDAIGPYLDAWRVDIKGFSDDLYRRLSRVKGWRGILEVTKRARKKWNMHVEVVTNIIPGMNDDGAQLGALASWIYNQLGELTPWHVTRFYPHHNLMNLPATPVETLERAWETGKKAGLRFVYPGNVPGHEKENTECYSCGRVVISRMGYNTRVIGINGSRCAFCGAELNVHGQ